MSKRKKNKAKAPKRANQPQAVAARSPQVAKPRATATAPRREVKSSVPMAFNNETYLWLAGAFGLVLIGLLLMTGGGQPDPNEWDTSIIYSWRRITLAPIIMLAGVGVAIYAIFKK